MLNCTSPQCHYFSGNAAFRPLSGLLYPSISNAHS